MLQNEILVAKIGFDPAENEPWKEWCVVRANPPPLPEQLVGVLEEAADLRDESFGAISSSKFPFKLMSASFQCKHSQMSGEKCSLSVHGSGRQAAGHRPPRPLSGGAGSGQAL